jgi:hypothetical protein
VEIGEEVRGKDDEEIASYEVTIPLRVRLTSVGKGKDEALAFAYEFVGDWLNSLTFLSVEFTDALPVVVRTEWPEDEEDES